MCTKTIHPRDHSVIYKDLGNVVKVPRHDQDQHAVVSQLREPGPALEDLASSVFGQLHGLRVVVAVVQPVGRFHDHAEVATPLAKSVFVEEKMEALADEREQLVLVSSLQHVPHGELLD